MQAAELHALLPWRHPFLMIDRMLECTPHRAIVTLKRISSGDPVVSEARATGGWLPGVLLIEGMSQSAALLHLLTYAEGTPSRPPLLGHFKASLHGSARVGETVRFEVDSIKMTHSAGVFDARARVGTALIAEAELAFAASSVATEESS